MAKIKDDRWSPSNLQQQRLQVRIERLLDNIEASKTTVSLAQVTQPSREEWEAAYERQTEFSPPIPFGVKLVWIDTGQNMVKSYATTLDNSGVYSTGAIKELVNTEEKYQPIRYIASGYQYILQNVFQSVFTQYRSDNTGTVSTNTPFVNELKLALQGAQAMLFIFTNGNGNIAFQDSDSPVQIDVNLGTFPGLGWVQQSHDGTTMTVTEDHVSKGWTDPTFNMLTATAFGDYNVQGVMFINNIQDLLVNEEIEKSQAGANGWILASGASGNINAAGNMEGIFSTFNTFDAKKIMIHGLQNLIMQYGLVDVYAIYDKKTASNLAEGKWNYVVQ